MGHSLQIFDCLTEHSSIINGHLAKVSTRGTESKASSHYPQYKAKSSPGRRGVDRVVLYGDIAKCYKLFNPDDDLLDYISEDDSVAITFLERPGFLRAHLSFRLCFFQDLGKHITTADSRQVKAVPEFEIQGVQRFVPQILRENFRGKDSRLVLQGHFSSMRVITVPLDLAFRREVSES